MNVVHIQNVGGVGGIAVLTRDIAKTSKQNNLFYFIYEGGEIAQQISEYAAVNVAASPRKKILSAAKAFAEYCKLNKADVLVEHTGTAIGLSCALYAQKKLGAKLIIYWHSNASYFEAKGAKSLIELFLKRLAYKKCDAAVAISDSVKQSYLERYGYKKDKITVVYNGIECAKFSSKRLESNVALPFNIIYVGRVFQAKGTHVLIEAMNRLSDGVKENVRLKIVGNDLGTYTEQMIEKTKELGLDGIIEFTGERLDVPELLGEADLFVHPAICKEGFGITLAEAMASYVPCAAFRLGAIPEVIDDGENGFIVENVSPKELAAAIEKAYSLFNENRQEYNEMRFNARKKAETFSIESTVNALEGLYA